MREKAIVADIQRRIRERWPNAYVRKLSDQFTRGLPDLLVIYEGTCIGIEVKRPGRRATELQAEEGRAIAAAGGIWICADCWPDVLAALSKGVEQKNV